MKNLVVLTGAGMSAESGISTFRDAGGLWEGHDIMEVASPEGWRKNPELVLDFYNKRRQQLATVKPNKAHLYLASLESKFNVQIITQNVDDLHERAGSKQILHLHGQLTQAKSTGFPTQVMDIGYHDIKPGDNCKNGFQLRPNIVWFGEDVPMFELARQICEKADVLVVIGTSMVVYPAAGLVHYAPKGIPLIAVDPNANTLPFNNFYELIALSAVDAIGRLNEIIERIAN